MIPLGITGEGKDCGVVIVSADERGLFLSELTRVQEPKPAKIITTKPIPPNAQPLSKIELLCPESTEGCGFSDAFDIGSGR